MSTLQVDGPPVPPPARRWPAALQLLLSTEARGLLEAAVQSAGSRLQWWRPRQVDHRPGRSTTVQYRAGLELADGSARTVTVVAVTGDRIPGGAAVLDDGSTRVGVWAWPFDPSLPGLTAALDRARTARLVDDLPIGRGLLSRRVRAYRPGRRAVVEVTGARGRLFVKVVRPGVVERLHHTHRMLARALPVPDSLGWTADGALVLPALRGRTVRELLRTSDGAVPPPSEVDAMLDRLPAALAQGPIRRSLVASASHHGSVLASVLPDRRPLIEDVVGRVQARPVAEHPVEPVHGDLYEAQLLASGGRITGVLDVDTAGGGARIDDLATFCAHLSVLALAADRPEPIRRYGAALLAHAERRFDPADLRPRIAAAVVALATGPFRVQEPDWQLGTERRLALASAWLDRAG